MTNNIQFTFKAINENEEQVLNLTINKAIDIVTQPIEKVVYEFEQVIHETVNKLGFDIELYDVKENVIYKGHKYLPEDTHYLTVEIECQDVDFSHHGFSE